MKITYTLLALFLSSSVFAQSESFSRNEIGTDLSYLMVIYADGTLDYATMELFYKRQFKSGNMRFKGSFGSPTTHYQYPIASATISTLNNEQLRYESYLIPNRVYSFSPGYEYVIGSSCFRPYFGADLLFSLVDNLTNVHLTSYERVNSTADWVLKLGKHHKRIRAMAYQMGVVPFVGTKFAIGSRLFLTTEFAWSFYHERGRTAYMDGQESEIGVSYYYTKYRYDKILADIALSLRF